MVDDKFNAIIGAKDLSILIRYYSHPSSIAPSIEGKV